MGLFDDFGKRVTQTGQSLISRATEMADISKLNTQIDEEEARRKSFFMQLGEAYYQKQGQAPDEEFATLCNNITECSEKIIDLNKQLAQAKKIKICPKCGAECEGLSAFCGSCGTELPRIKDVQADKKYCVNCGQQIVAEAVFCPFCGNKG